jgi:hypothetical protein
MNSGKYFNTYFEFLLTNRMPFVSEHTLVCPERIVANSAGLSTEEWLQIIQVKEVVCLRLWQFLGAEGAC